MKRVDQVFGISTTVRPDSYVDRGELDERIQLLLTRNTHVALRGESKCGKSWLRQQNIPNAIVVQARLGRTVTDLYVDALSQLQIEFTVQKTRSTNIKGSVKATGSIGTRILGALGLEVAGEASRDTGSESAPAGRNIDDLRHVAEIIRESGRRFVIEDFHYLSIEERRCLSFDIKAFWDYQLYVVIVGVWSRNNMLLTLNPDLSGRIEELSIYWSNEDLSRILERGGRSLGITFTQSVVDKLTSISFGNAGILQQLTVGALDKLGIVNERLDEAISSVSAVDDAALSYASQLEALYSNFAARVSGGIRARHDSTGIYPHTLAVLFACTDDDLIQGVPFARIFQAARGRQARIQSGNLKVILGKFEELQVDDRGAGLILSWNPATETVSVVDRQILLYRQYCTVKWPWEELIAESEQS